MKRLSMMIILSAAALAVWLGASAVQIGEYSGRLVQSCFPVRCDVEYTDPASGEKLVLNNASVRFDGRQALISHGMADLETGVDEAVFVYAEPAAHSRNQLRSIMLSALLLGAGLTFCGTLLRIGLLMRREAIRRSRARRRRVLPAQYAAALHPAA